MGLLLGQVSKWRAQRGADRAAHAARGYSLSPPPPLRGPPPPLAQGRLGYAPFSRRITQYQLPPPMRGKWRAQRADGGAHAARGFVGGAARSRIGANLDTSRFQCRTRLCGWCSRCLRESPPRRSTFQCRTRLCGWCSFVALSSCPPKRKKAFWKVSGNLSVLTENM